MKVQLFMAVTLSLATVVCVSAQTRTITNFDLEKYKEQRLAADRDYRENYARFGMPSPDEIDRRLAEKRADMEKLSAKLRGERLEQEQLDAARQTGAVYSQEPEYYQPQYDGGFISVGTVFPQRRFRRFHQFRQFQQPTGYFAGGQFWETPPPKRDTSRPIRSPR